MLIHWDEVPPVELEAGDLGGRRRRLGVAAGAPRLGLSRWELDPGRRAMPFHVHADEEEIFYVLGGGGLSIEGDHAYAVRAGDAILYPAAGLPHAIVAGEEGLDLLAFGSGSDTGLTWLPRPNVMFASPRWLPLDGPHPFLAEAACGALEPPAPSRDLPATIARIADVEPRDFRRGDVGNEIRDLGTATGSTRTGMQLFAVDAGRLSAPPHCHSAEEELFVVLEGDGALELLHPDGSAESHPVHAGHVIARPAGTGVAHAFGAGDGGLTVLAYGHRDPSDVCFYPRSGKLSIRGVKAIFRVQRADYWDGEE